MKLKKRSTYQSERCTTRSRAETHEAKLREVQHTENKVTPLVSRRYESAHETGDNEDPRYNYYLNQRLPRHASYEEEVRKNERRGKEPYFC